mmetsp:Transcript_24564/g.46728  ORF Transcript_24564/g.46728 Transcript_24564/m.46728 type:complete len:90 (+) Transcript_24564:120-389(+)
MRHFLLYLTLLHWGAAGAGDAEGDSFVECGIWIAPSTIHGTGLGMFAGRDFDPKGTLDYGDAWEDVWLRHLQNWKPVDDAESLMSQPLN